MSGRRSRTVTRTFCRVALPLASYYAVTLALPLANGAAPSGAFMEHALLVLVVPPMAIIFACAVHTIANGLAGLAAPAIRADASPQFSYSATSSTSVAGRKPPDWCAQSDA